MTQKKKKKKRRQRDRGPSCGYERKRLGIETGKNVETVKARQMGHARHKLRVLRILSGQLKGNGRRKGIATDPNTVTLSLERRPWGLGVEESQSKIRNRGGTPSVPGKKNTSVGRGRGEAQVKGNF